MNMTSMGILELVVVGILPFATALIGRGVWLRWQVPHGTQKGRKDIRDEGLPNSGRFFPLPLGSIHKEGERRHLPPYPLWFVNLQGDPQVY
jgi:hypothetical protein